MKLPAYLKKNCTSIETPSIASLTTAGVGGRALSLIEPHDGTALAGLLSFLRSESILYRVLGGGSNVLGADESYDGVIVGTRRINAVDFGRRADDCGRRADDFGRRADDFGRPADGATLTIRVGAGAFLPRLVSWCASRGLSGVECLVGIPGTVGGAVVMNAGGKYGRIESVLQAVMVVDEKNETALLKKAECGFGYRSSGLGEKTVIEAFFRLEKSTPQHVKSRTSAILGEKKRAQPLDAKSCGCIFKNPPGVSAGKLLEEIGLKGFCRGGALVSLLHANFMVNQRNASRADFDFLIREARQRVKDRFCLNLELEVERW